MDGAGTYEIEKYGTNEQRYLAVLKKVASVAI